MSAACPQCGSVPPPGSPAGHCAVCLGRAAFAFSESEEPAKPAVEAGQAWSVLGDCELMEEIGRGGMGVVSTISAACSPVMAAQMPVSDPLPVFRTLKL